MSWLQYPGNADDPLDMVRGWVQHKKREGVICPCCDQQAKTYRRKLYGAMAYALGHIYLHYQRTKSTDWLHVPTYLSSVTSTVAVRGGDWAKLRYWDLIVPQPGDRGDGSHRNGFYKITPTGIAFVELRWQVPQHVYIYNQEVLGYEGPDIVITDALGDKFDYNTLMAA